LAAAVEWVKAALIVCQTHGTEISAIGDGKLTVTVSPAFVAALGLSVQNPVEVPPQKRARSGSAGSDTIGRDFQLFGVRGIRGWGKNPWEPLGRGRHERAGWKTEPKLSNSSNSDLSGVIKLGK